MDLATFLIQCLNSLQYGLLLFLVASGLTLIFGIMGVINLAHGSFYMIGAYMAFALAPVVATTFGGGFFAVLLVGTVLAERYQIEAVIAVERRALHLLIGDQLLRRRGLDALETRGATEIQPHQRDTDQEQRPRDGVADDALGFHVSARAERPVPPDRFALISRMSLRETACERWACGP